MTEATGFRRFTSLLIDFLLCWSLAYVFVSQETLRSFLESYSFYKSLPGLFSEHVVVSVLLLFLLRFYSGLFFASTPGFFVAGLRVRGHNLIQERVSMAFRALIMPILLILLPIDYFLSQFGKARISEIISGTNIERRGGILTLLSAVLFLLISLLTAYAGPLFYKSTFLYNPVVAFTPKIEVPLSKGRDFNLYRNYGSKSFKMMTFSDLDSGRFKVNPSFEIRRKTGNIIYRPIMSIWDTTLGVKGVFKINKRFDLMRLVKKVKTNYPFFDVYYPNLNKGLKVAQMLDDDYELDDKAKEELFELISVSLLANPFSVTEFFKKKRIFLFPYILLKRELFSLLGENDQQKIDFITRGSEVFIRTLTSDDFKNEYKEKFFSLKQLKPIVYETVWQRNRWDSKVNETFAKSFFYKSKWGRVVEREATTWEQEYIFNPLSIYDFLGYKDFSSAGLKKFEKYLRKYYFKEARSSFGFGEDYQKLFLASMQRVFITWQLMMKREKIPYSKMTIKNISDIMRALKSRNKDFFNGE